MVKLIVAAVATICKPVPSIAALVTDRVRMDKVANKVHVFGYARPTKPCAKTRVPHCKPTTNTVVDVATFVPHTKPVSKANVPVLPD